MAVAAMHVHEEPPPIAAVRPGAPARLESVAMAALAKDPAERARAGGRAPAPPHDRPDGHEAGDDRASDDRDLPTETLPAETLPTETETIPPPPTG